MKKKFSHDKIVQGLRSSIRDATTERDEKSARVQSYSEEKGQKTAQLGQTKADLAADEHFLSDLRTECDAKSADFEKRQELRQEEIEAINKAIEIMSGAAVAGGTQHLPGLIQQDATSFAQLR